MMLPTVTQDLAKANFEDILRRALLARRYHDALAERARLRARGRFSRVIFAYRLRWRARRQRLARRRGEGNWQKDLNRIIIERL